MGEIRLQNLSVAYENQLILQNISHHFAAGQWHIIIGRSGMGKSTLLHAIANLLPPNAQISGEISDQQGQALHGQIAYMGQHNDLLAWLNVRENLLLDARLHRKHKDYARAEQLLNACGLQGLGKHYPSQLSGGQRQRVALARTLMQASPYVLMDEPFSALDAITRYELQNLAAQLLKNKTVVMITHDPSEALRLADSLHILSQQHLQALALPPNAPPRALNSVGLANLQATLIEALRHV